MGDCTHDLAERETACADGMCPLCLERELAEARDRGDVAVADHALVIVERYRLRAAGFWLIHLVNDVGKAGGKPEPGEWEEAWDSLRRALDGEG